MTIGILTEKPSAARNFAKALGGARGTFAGQAYVIVAARGHLYELADPAAMVPASKTSQYKTWDVGNLPWDPADLSWERVMQRGASETVKTIRTALAPCAEIVIATDVDPTGEGQAIAWNIIDELGMHSKKISRMDFTDEAPASLRTAFTARYALPVMMDDPEYKKADLRTKFDLLTMQFTRIATLCASQRAVLRQGRLKSAMVKLVGDQLKAHDGYVKTSVFQNRFRDENGVLYTDPGEATYPTHAAVPQSYSASVVVRDSATAKSTGPPRLLDLAGLSARLSGQGFKADAVLATYQKMYEDLVVSYPRTEDKTITSEQFKELAPKVDAIAALAGVDPASLTHRSPRATHVKDTGAHGANRPGPGVPSSLDALRSRYGPAAVPIYTTLARSYLAMLAPDYRYEAQEGHVGEHPSFVGRASVPKVLGWKAVFGAQDDEADDDAKGLGTTADPVVYEIVPPRPEHPTMKWLMKQLDKRDVGTGATRTSTYAEVTKAASASNKYPLLHESRGKITMTEFGDMGYRLLPGTRIGDLGMTEHVYAAMRRVARGESTTQAELAIVATWVSEDITTMTQNASSMRKELGLNQEKVAKEKFEGHWAKTGQHVRFSREWSGTRFTDEQCAALLGGEVIEFTATSRSKGTQFQARGELAEQKFTPGDGKEVTFVGFKPDFGPVLDANGLAEPPPSWCQHTFTAGELTRLKAGEKVYVEGFTSKKGNTFNATVSFAIEDGKIEKRIVPEFG